MSVDATDFGNPAGRDVASARLYGFWRGGCLP